VVSKEVVPECPRILTHRHLLIVGGSLQIETLQRANNPDNSDVKYVLENA
jgi:hypothetical protein